jgi:galactokinase
MPSSVPVVDSLDAIYPRDELPAQAVRWNALAAAFTARFGRTPALVARSPGRVNLIGEHIDYSLYPVVPMAISADAILAVSATTAAPSGKDGITVRIANVDPHRFPEREFTVAIPADAAAQIESGIDASVHEWSNYFRAGLAGALRLLRRKGVALEPAVLDVLMDGSVPPGGGLSSSAAFTSASALAVLATLQPGVAVADVDREELTEVAIVSERDVGVHAGG